MWELMLEKAKAVMQLAYCPYSNFQVGACIVTESGDYFVGCNVENASYSMTIDAEANAIAHMVAAGQQSIKAILILCHGETPCAPCGACRQKIREFAQENTAVMMCSIDANGKLYQQESTLGVLMPHSFGPDFLDDCG